MEEADGWTGGGWMDTQKGAHGCATTTPVLQTPQLPGTAPARPEVTRLLPTMPLPFSNGTLLSISVSRPLCLSFSLCSPPLPSSVIRSALLLHPLLLYAIASSTAGSILRSMHTPYHPRRCDSHIPPCHLHTYARYERVTIRLGTRCFVRGMNATRFPRTTSATLLQPLRRQKDGLAGQRSTAGSNDFARRKMRIWDTMLRLIRENGCRMSRFP